MLNLLGDERNAISAGVQVREFHQVPEVLELRAQKQLHNVEEKKSLNKIHEAVGLLNCKGLSTDMNLWTGAHGAPVCATIPFLRAT